MLKRVAAAAGCALMLSGCAVTVDRADTVSLYPGDTLEKSKVAFFEYLVEKPTDEERQEYMHVSVATIDGEPVPRDAKYLEVLPGEREVKVACLLIREVSAGDETVNTIVSGPQLAGATVDFKAGRVMTINAMSFENNFCSVDFTPRAVQLSVTRPDR